MTKQEKLGLMCKQGNYGGDKNCFIDVNIIINDFGDKDDDSRNRTVGENGGNDANNSNGISALATKT